MISKLYRGVAVPRMTYGLEVVPLKSTGTKILEDCHRDVAKMTQNLPLSTSNPAPLATLGWMSLESYIELKKMCFSFRTLCMKNIFYADIVYHTIRNDMAADKYIPTSPVSSMLKTVVKYQASELMLNAMERGPDTSYEDYKKKLKCIVWEHYYYY